MIERYAGGDIVLQAGNVISTKTTPELSDLIGKTLVTTDGNTLLGGDDKAGIAIIMELAHHLIEHPHLPTDRCNCYSLAMKRSDMGRITLI